MMRTAWPYGQVHFERIDSDPNSMLHIAIYLLKGKRRTNGKKRYITSSAVAKPQKLDPIDRAFSISTLNELASDNDALIDKLKTLMPGLTTESVHSSYLDEIGWIITLKGKLSTVHNGSKFAHEDIKTSDQDRPPNNIHEFGTECIDGDARVTVSVNSACFEDHQMDSNEDYTTDTDSMCQMGTVLILVALALFLLIMVSHKSKKRIKQVIWCFGVFIAQWINSS